MATSVEEIRKRYPYPTTFCDMDLDVRDSYSVLGAFLAYIYGEEVTWVRTVTRFPELYYDHELLAEILCSTNTNLSKADAFMFLGVLIDFFHKDKTEEAWNILKRTLEFRMELGLE